MAMKGEICMYIYIYIVYIKFEIGRLYPIYYFQYTCMKEFSQYIKIYEASKIPATMIK